MLAFRASSLSPSGTVGSENRRCDGSIQMKVLWYMGAYRRIFDGFRRFLVPCEQSLKKNNDRRGWCIYHVVDKGEMYNTTLQHQVYHYNTFQSFISILRLLSRIRFFYQDLLCNLCVIFQESFAVGWIFERKEFLTGQPLFSHNREC